MRLRSRTRYVLEGLEGIALAALVLPTWPLTSRWLRNWGARSAECDHTWPGDALVAEDHSTYTRAISIRVSRDRVWPWLVQFGLGRAGFYSYELFERVVGIPVRNVESIVSDFQQLSEGDEILLHPKAPGIPVALLDTERHVCFGVAEAERAEAARPDTARSWSMYLEPESSTATRLVLRACIELPRRSSLVKRIGGGVEASIDFVMEQRMLRTLKRLAEERGIE